jgi:hypothetical protein
MSTVDPRILREQKAAKAQSSPSAWGITAAVAVVHVALWALAGFGIASQEDVFRLMSINPVTAWDSPFENDFWMIFVGVFPAAWLGFYLSSRLRPSLSGLSAGIAPFATAFLGLAIGTALFYPHWTPPEHVGFTAGFGNDAPSVQWDAGAWISYYQPYWLPAVFVVVFLVGVILVLRFNHSAQEKQARILGVVENGSRALGQVSEANSGTVWVNNSPLVSLTVAYKDLNGQQRWVTKRQVFTPTQVPRVGDTFTVWYDQNDPGNQKKIALAAGDISTAAVEAAIGPKDAAADLS